MIVRQPEGSANLDESIAWIHESLVGLILQEEARCTKGEKAMMLSDSCKESTGILSTPTNFESICPQKLSKKSEESFGSSKSLQLSLEARVGTFFNRTCINSSLAKLVNHKHHQGERVGEGVDHGSTIHNSSTLRSFHVFPHNSEVAAPAILQEQRYNCSISRNRDKGSDMNIPSPVRD